MQPGLQKADNMRWLLDSGLCLSKQTKLLQLFGWGTLGGVHDPPESTGSLGLRQTLQVALSSVYFESR